MDVQTESHTPIDTGLSCYEKARARGELTFTLVEQDASAPAVIKFWVKAQQRIETGMKAGLTLDQAVQALEAYYFLDTIDPSTITDKQARALAIAEGMAGYDGRRLAD